MEPITATFFDLARADLRAVEERMRSHDGRHHPRLDAAIGQLLLSGGKRIRPTLAVLMGGLLGGDKERVITLAAAVEMLHTATLVHDDLIDGSLLRRGAPTLNAQWSAGATVLTGDYVFARAAHLAAEIESVALMRIFSRTLMTIVNGEITQLFRTRRGLDPRKDYLERIHAKTASLFEAAAEGAATLSGSPESDVVSMKSFGYEIGMAFQIMDDVLDFTGEASTLGKPVASDLRQGLVTLPTVCYMETNPGDDVLERFLGEDRPDERGVEGLIQRIRKSGAIERAVREAEDFVESGRARLTAFAASPEREALDELACYVVQRIL